MSEGRKHSILAPSAASRWMACPPSARLAEKMEDDKSSAYAAEGQLAHQLAELYLKDYIYGREWMAAHPGQSYFPTVANPSGVEAVMKAKRDPLFYDDMTGEIRKYTDAAIALWDGAGAGAVMRVEEKVPLFYKPDDAGTVDCLVYGGVDKTLYVTDLKFGKGVLVEAEGNKQLLIYAISAYDQLKGSAEIEKVVMTIVQPRRDSTTSWALGVEDLEMERDLIEAKARKALAGEGDFKTGEQCRFCPVKPRCRALKDAAAAMAETEFEDPALLTHDEIARLLGQIDTIADWIGSVKSYALERAVAGDRFEGYKLVAGVSRRKITDEKAIYDALVAAGYEGPLLKRTSFVTIGELEKTVAAEDFAACCAPWIAKPDAPSMLVAASDPRMEYGVTKAVKDFEEFKTE